ncbi:MAG: methionyl-tRNA formyltransferase [Longimicrobiales bacterium]
MRVIFWGTPLFAVPSLQALLGEMHEVVAVVTQPDRPAGRGRTLRASPVKQLALEEMIPVLQPERARAPEFLEELGAFKADANVVVAYGQILPRSVLEVWPRGSFNVHASLLPALRGAAPINWAIDRGDRKTGVTIMRMVEQMDAGPVLLQVEEPIEPEETASDLTSRLSEIGAEALIEALAMIEADDVVEIEQDESRATFAPRITREHAHVDWTRTATEVARRIRAMDEVPGAWTVHRDKDLKLFRPLVHRDAHSAAPGTVIDVAPEDPASGMLVACGSGAVHVREVKPAGKRRMTTAEWLRGRGAEPGDVLT